MSFGDTIVGCAFFLFLLVISEAMLSSICGNLPLLYLSVFFIVLVLLLGTPLIKTKYRVSSMFYCVVLYVIICGVIPTILTHASVGISELEPSASFARTAAHIKSQKGKGAHYIATLLSTAYPNGNPQYSYISKTIIPSSSSENISFKLMGVIDNAGNSYAHFNRVLSWVRDRRQVIVDVVQGDQKTTIEMSAIEYQKLIDDIKYVKLSLDITSKNNITQAEKDQEQVEKDTSGLQQDIERAKKL